MSLSLGLGLAGAGIGAFAGVPALGFVLGNLAGNLLVGRGDGPGAPRIEDASVQSSALGAPKYRGWGTYQFAGNVIWALPLHADERTEDVGKGGGSEVTTYEYSATFASAACEAPLAGSGAVILRIWADAKLIADYTEGSTLQPTWITLYTGAEDQLPDPLMEANEGVGEVPAYRGTVYAVFDRMPVTQLGLGARYPSMRFEVGFATAETGFLVEPPWPTRPAANEQIWYYSQNDLVTFGATGNGSGSGFNLTRTTWTRNGTLVDNTPVLYTGEGSGTVQVYGPVRQTGVVGVKELAVGTQNGLVCWINNRTAMPSLGHIQDDTATNLPFSVWQKPVFDSDLEIVYVHTGTSGPTYLYDVSIVGDTIITVQTARTRYQPAGGGAVHDVHPLNSRAYVLEVVSAQSRITLIDPLTTPPTVIETWTLVTNALSALSTVLVDEGISPRRAIVSLGASRRYYVFELPDGGGAGTELESGDVFDPGGYTGEPARLDARTMHHRQQLIVTRRIVGAPVNLGEVIRDTCILSNIDSADVDVTGVIDEVNGVGLTRQANGQQFLTPLLSAFQIDVAETGGKLVFRSRSTGPTVMTIPDEDLASAVIAGQGELPGPINDSMRQERQQVDELPRTVILRYRNIDRQHESNAQAFKVIDNRTANDRVIELAVAMTDDLAARIGERVALSAWTERNSFSTALGPHYLALDPGDAVTIQNRRLRITQITLDYAALHMALSLVADQPAVLSPTSTGATDPNPPDPSPPQTGITLLSLLDIPLLRDEDIPVEVGFYWGASGVLTDWPGAILLRSKDQGTTWEQISSRSTSSSSGTAQTVLADGPETFDWNKVDWTLEAEQPWDTVNTVDILLSTPNPLANASRAEILAGANTALLGDEIIGFEVAADQGGGVWRLSGLLRGRRGTEAARLTHAAAERFVALEVGGTGHVAHGTDEYSRERDYRAPTYGADITTAAVQQFTNTGVGLRPFSPVGLKATRPPPGTGWTVTIDAVRRSRYGTEYRNFSSDPPPLDAPAEGYEFHIWDPGQTQIKRVEETTSPLFAYTEAKQNTDFGDAGQAFHVKIYQINSTYPVNIGTPQAIDFAGFTDGGTKDPTKEPIPNQEDVVLAGEGITAGDMLNIYDDNGTRARKADRSAGYVVHAYATETVSAGDALIIARAGYVTGVGTTPGAAYYLALAGAVDTAEPSTATEIRQQVGVGTDSGLMFRPGPVTRKG